MNVGTGARRRPARYLAAGVAALLAFGAVGSQAAAAPSDESEALAELIDVEGLGLEVLEALTQASGSPSDPGPSAGEINADVLEGLIGLSLPGIGIPLIGDGTNGGLLDLGPQAGVGATNAYASSSTPSTSVAAVGAVTNEGAIDVAPEFDPADINNAQLDLTALLSQLEVDGLTDQLVSELGIALGAVAARAEATGPETYESDYLLAGAELRVQSPTVGGLAGTLDTTYDSVVGGVETAVSNAVGEGGTIDNALGLLEIPELNVLGLVTLEIEEVSAAIDLSIPDLSEALLTEAVSDDGLITIDLTDGTIAVDVAQLLKGEGGEDLNGLPPNTSVLTDDTIEAITAGVASALGNLVDSLNAQIVTGLQESDLTITLDGQATALLALVSVPVSLTVEGTLAGFAGLEGAPTPVVDSDTAIVMDLPFPLEDINIPAGTLVSAVGGTVLPLVLAGVGPVVDTLLTTQSAVVESTLTGVVDAVLEPLEPVLDGVLRQIATLTINEQPTAAPINGTGDLGANSFTVRALAIDVLPLLGDEAVSVNLASASVRADVPVPTVVATPDPVQQGGELTATGTSFTPETEVTVTYVDSDGTTIATPTVLTDASGAFTSTITVPDDAATGLLTVTATDGTLSAADTVQVIAPAAAPAVTASPDPVQQGGTLTAVGVGFTPGSDVTVTYTDDDEALIGTSTVTADGAGGFTDTLEVPEDTPLGALTVTATEGEDVASDTVQVIAAAVPPSITATPDPVQQGGVVDVVGVGFAPNSEVTVTYTDDGGAVIGSNVATTDGAGGFTDSLGVPEATPVGVLTVTATGGDDIASDTVQVIAPAVAPAVTATPDPVQQGGTLDVVGVGFAPGAGVALTYTDDDENVIATRTVLTDGAGGFTDSLEVPEDTPLGDLTVTATEGDDTASDTVQVIAAAVEPAVTATPDPVQQGGTLDVVGVGFAPNTPLTVTYTDADGTVIGTNPAITDGAGGFTDSLTVPADTPLGDLTVTATGGEDTATDTVDVIAAAVAPAVTAEPDPVQQGGTLEVVGVGFAPDAEVALSYTDADENVVNTTVFTDGAGGFTDSFEVPEDTPLGDLTVTATEGEDSASDTVQVIAAAVEPAVTATPDPVQQGGTLEVVGVGFAPNAPVTSTYIDADGDVILTSTVVTDGAGGFMDWFDVPEDTLLGDLTVESTDGDVTASDTVQVIAAAVEPAVTATPDPVQQGGTLDVTGVGFAPDSLLTVTYTGADGLIFDAHLVITDAAGGFTDSVEVPVDAPLGNLTVTGTAGEDTASDTVQVIAAAVDPAVTAEPDPVQQGGTLEVTGVGFAPNAPVTVTYTDAEGDEIASNDVVTDGAGGFSDSIVVPEGTPLGDLTVTATDGEDTATDTVEVTEAAVAPAVTAEPDPVQQGGTLDVTGVGFAPNTPVTVVYTDADGTEIGTSPVITDGAGGFTDSLTVPEDTPLGDLTVTATGGEDTATDTVEVIAAAVEPAVTAEPDPVEQGGTLEVVGVGFAPNTPVTVTYTDADGGEIGTSTVITDDAGGFFDSIVVPEDTPLGELTVTATDGEDTATDTVEVTEAAVGPSIVVSPDPVDIGEDITVEGEGFEPDTEVTIVYTDSEGEVIAEHTVTTDENGEFTDTLTVPEGTPVGTLVVEASDGTDTATDTTTVLEPGVVYDPEIEVTPGTVEPGDPVTSVCVGFPPNTQVTFTYTDAAGNVVATRVVTTDAEGACTDTVVLPEDTVPGPLTVTASGGGYTVTETILVAAPADGIGIAVEHDTRYRGQVQTGYGTGYAPGTVVQGYMNSFPQLDLGTQVADANGTVTFVWTIPANAAIDSHTFSLEADGYVDQSVSFRVLATPAAGLPDTGSDPLPAGAVAGLLLLLGLGLMVANRSMKQRTES